MTAGSYRFCANCAHGKTRPGSVLLCTLGGDARRTSARGICSNWKQRESDARGLTSRQRKLLALLQSAERPLTMRELCAAMNIASTNGVANHLLALERRGYIERPHDRSARQVIRVVRPLPELADAEAVLVQVRRALQRSGSPEEVLAAARRAAGLMVPNEGERNV